MIERTYLDKFCGEKQDFLRNLQKYMRHCPQGQLKVEYTTVKLKRYARFYVSRKMGGKIERKSISKDKVRLEEFAEKAYWEEMARRVEKNAALLKACVEGLEADDYKSVLGALNPDIAKHVSAERVASQDAIMRSARGLERGVAGMSASARGLCGSAEELSRAQSVNRKEFGGAQLVNLANYDAEDWESVAERVKKWREDTLAGNYKRLEAHQEGLRHRATDGALVRSKSELSITEILQRFGQVVRHDWEVEINDVKLHPDFAIMKGSGQLIFWEHFGKMNDAKYVELMHTKLRIYEAAGIVPWKNLIVTYDSEDGNIDLAVVESEIRNKLLR